MREKRQKRKKNRNKKGSKIAWSIIISLSILISMYVAISGYFINHFYPGSQINGIDVSFATVNEAEEKITSSISTYTLELEGRDGIKEKINGKDIDLKSNQKEKIKTFKDNQNPLKWVTSLVNKSDLQIDEIMTFDKELLKENLAKLNLFNNKNEVEPKDVAFKYEDEEYKIIDEVKGNKIKKEVVYEKVENAILNGKEKLNLDEAECYENPKYTSKSKEVIEAKELLNKYTSLKITYNTDEGEEVDGSIINKWLNVDKDMNVTFDESKVRRYVDSLAVKYNTVRKTRDFTTSQGKKIQISGGNYGFIVNKEQEIKSLIEIVKKGKNATKDIIYSQKAISHDENDIGNTYIEINFTKQHMWLYKDGSLVVETDVVTGDIGKNFGTPTGTYRVAYKERNATLKGEDYSTKVDFWMPFNGGIGIHDATWRNEFGKDIYMKNGSHGCINTPYAAANTIFDNIQAGIPVICYYE